MKAFTDAAIGGKREEPASPAKPASAGAEEIEFVSCALDKTAGQPSAWRDMFSALLHIVRRRHVALVNAPISAQPRWGHGRAYHRQLYELINRNRDAYVRQMEQFLKCRDQLTRIERLRTRQTPLTAPCWKNKFLPAADAVALYGFLAHFNPQRYYEIGSGNSTMFARQAIDDHRLRTRITSFDPQPRAEIDTICDRSVRACLEDIDVRTFARLEAGDALFLDGSHYVFTNSDTVAFFLDILPILKPGVLIQIHDVWLPADYPARWSRHFFSEQYLLGCYLLGGSSGLEVLLPNRFIADDPELANVLGPLWQESAFEDVIIPGASFWMRKV